ncbi:hypothetical protein [Oceanobacillus senegalensis]|uniref:hypothetical protein n=1 Tax=Oceanobacillus senegalensis TaxID=1936063 RepID=UPI001C4FAF91|nr:hypothetical protein [Oceanobacillus senegalensis]
MNKLIQRYKRLFYYDLIFDIIYQDYKHFQDELFDEHDGGSFYDNLPFYWY